MQTARGSAAASVGARLLGEIDETTLDEVRGVDLVIAMCWSREVGWWKWKWKWKWNGSKPKDGQRRASNVLC